MAVISSKKKNTAAKATAVLFKKERIYEKLKGVI